MFAPIGFAVLSLFPFSISAQQCYFPNGDPVNSDTACNPNSLVSACCFDGQACLSNGLCVSDPNNSTLARLHRGTCTDKSWKSGNCPRHCLDIDNNGVPVHNCNATDSPQSYCCFDDCSCDAGHEVFKFEELNVWTVTIIGDKSFQPQTTAPSSAVPSSLASSITSSVSVSVSSNEASTTVDSVSTSTQEVGGGQSSSGGSSSNSTAIGVGVGVGVGGLLLVGIGVFIFLRRRNRKNSGASKMAEIDSGNSTHPVEAPSTEYHPLGSSQKYAQFNDGKSPHQRSNVSEMPANSEPIELDSAPLRTGENGTSR